MKLTSWVNLVNPCDSCEGKEIKQADMRIAVCRHTAKCITFIASNQGIDNWLDDTGHPLIENNSAFPFTLQYKDSETHIPARRVCSMSGNFLFHVSQVDLCFTAGPRNSHGMHTSLHAQLCSS